MSRTISTKAGLLFLFGVAAVFLIIVAVVPSGNDTSATPSTQLLPEVADFLETHPEYGSVRNAQPMPDWARGRRQEVETTAGAYLFYIENGEVVTIYQNDASGRREVWRKPGS